MHHLLRLISLRYMRAAPLRTLSTLFGILLGVSVAFAIDVVNGSVMGSFRSTIDQVAGKTALTVGGSTGVPEEMLEVVRAVPGVAAAVPVIQESAHDERTDSQLVVLGIDTLSDGSVRDYEVTADQVKIEDDLAFLNDPHAVVITERFAERHGLANGDTLQLQTIAGKQAYTVRGTLAPRGPANVFGGDLLLMDVYAAQVAFERGKRFDHLDVVAASDADVPALRERIEQAIEGKASVTRPQRRTEEAERLTAGFRLGLSLAALVAMLVGGFIVYNALAIAVAQRRREIGILRALGTTRGQVLALFVGEGLSIGALGAVLGLGFGLLLAKLMLKLALLAVPMLNVAAQPAALLIAPRDWILALALGVTVAFVAAFFPARRAASTEPASVMRKRVDAGLASSSRSALLVSAVTLSVALSAAVVAHLREDYMLGYAVTALGALGAAFLARPIAIVVGSATRHLLGRRSPSVLLGSVGFVRNAGRNAVAIAALGVSLGNVVNADAFVESMKYSTESWFQRAARADLFLYAGQSAHTGVEQPLPDGLIQELASLPQVAHVEAYRTTQHSLDGLPFRLTSYDLEHYDQYNDLPVVSGDFARARPAIISGHGIAASESFLRASRRALGDTLTLSTPQGPHAFEIVLVYADYTADSGILLTDRRVYTRLWGDQLVDGFGVHLRAGAGMLQARDAITSGIGRRYRLVVLSNGEYKREIAGLIDRTFSLTRATELVAIVVAILGIVNTLLVTVMDRRTEIGMLKAIGADRAQLQSMLITEGALIGLSATVLGVALGAVFSAYIVKELMRFQVGWHLSWHLSGWAVLEIVIAAQLITYLSVWWPMRSTNRIDPVEALHYE